MNRNHLTSFVLVFSIAACTPGSAFQQVDVAYQPSAKVDTPEQRLAPSAVTFSESDLDAIKKAGGVYLGELDIRGERGIAAGSQQNGPTNLVGRASLEAAQRGATHFMLLTGGERMQGTGASGVAFTSDGPAPTASGAIDQIVFARFALMRVEPAHWTDLRAGLRPDPMPPS